MNINPTFRILGKVLFLLSILTLSAFASTSDVLIRFHTQPTRAEEALVHRLGGKVKHRFWLVKAIAASLPSRAITALSNNKAVRSIEPDGLFHKHDVELDNAWGVKHIGSGTAHTQGLVGSGIKVAIFDSGIDYSHPDLAGNYVGGYDFVNGDTDPMDDDGHGTHVAGTVGAVDNNNGVVGVAPGVELYALKVLDANGSGSFSNMIAALQWAVDNKIHVGNHSYGSSMNPGGTVQAAYDNAYNLHGLLHIASAGNSGKRSGKGNNVGYPARYESVVAVAATDENNNRASFSSTGDTVELSAPGVLINSTKLGGGYVKYNGTSMASPHVTGAAALLFGAGLTDDDGDTFLHKEVRQRLIDTAIELGDSGRDALFGYGLIDVPLAIDIGTVNYAPSLTILSPEVDPEATSTEEVFFEGFGSDAEEGDISHRISWVSSIDGSLFTGASLLVVLSDGNHSVTATVSDNDGKTVSKTINVTVGVPPPPVASELIVKSIEYFTEGGKNSDRHLNVTVHVIDSSLNNIANAEVSITLYRDSSPVGAGTALTGSNGKVTFQLKNAAKGYYTTTAESVVFSDLAWDGVTPLNGFDKK